MALERLTAVAAGSREYAALASAVARAEAAAQQLLNEEEVAAAAAAQGKKKSKKKKKQKKKQQSPRGQEVGTRQETVDIGPHLFPVAVGG